jgi:hypothetical protein
MIDEDKAVAELARTVGMALTTFAEAEIAEAPGLHTDDGMSSSEIASEIGYDPANTHTALKTLQERGIAVHGDRSRAQAVRRAYESLPRFPAHRVLRARWVYSGRRVHPPTDCRERRSRPRPAREPRALRELGRPHRAQQE